MTQTLVLASNNAGKLAEFSQLLAPRGFTLKSQRDLDIPEAEEPFGTFIENALAKARHASQLSGLPALADDSGICVPALGGAPGVDIAGLAGDGAVAGGAEVVALEFDGRERLRAFGQEDAGAVPAGGVGQRDDGALDDVACVEKSCACHDRCQESEQKGLHQEL